MSELPVAQQECPHCGTDLTYTHEGREYSHACMVEVRGLYDGGIMYTHLKSDGGCGRFWHRWPKGSTMYNRAAPYVERGNQKVREAELHERLAAEAEADAV